MTWDQVDATVLKQLYYEENLPDSLIAERFGVSKREVTKKRRQYDIGLRQRSVEKALAELPSLSRVTAQQLLPLFDEEERKLQSTVQGASALPGTHRRPGKGVH